MSTKIQKITTAKKKTVSSPIKKVASNKAANTNELHEKVQKIVRKRLVGKSYTLTHEELNKMQQIKERCLDKRMIVSDSQIIRLGIKLAACLSEAELIKELKKTPKISVGRPKKIQK